MKDSIRYNKLSTICLNIFCPYLVNLNITSALERSVLICNSQQTRPLYVGLEANKQVIMLNKCQIHTAHELSPSDYNYINYLVYHYGR